MLSNVPRGKKAERVLILDYWVRIAIAVPGISLERGDRCVIRGQKLSIILLLLLKGPTLTDVFVRLCGAQLRASYSLRIKVMLTRCVKCTKLRMAGPSFLRRKTTNLVNQTCYTFRRTS